MRKPHSNFQEEKTTTIGISPHQQLTTRLLRTQIKPCQEEHPEKIHPIERLLPKL